MSSSNGLTAHDIVSHITKTKSVLPLGVQADLLGISRTSVYYQLTPVAHTLAIMNRIDELYTKRPFYGSRKIAHELGYNRKRIQRLMREMGIEAIYQKPNLSRNAIQHPVYPYLLRNVVTGYPNHVWGTDITYVRMRQGFVYLVAFLDWHSRYVLSWRLSTMLTTDFVLEAAHDALTIGIPEIANSDQGMQFTNREYLSLWNPEKTKISMDGRGRAMDNIFTERLWRTVKYEEVYLKDYQSPREARQSLAEYFDFYNQGRLHQSLGYKTPAKIYFERG